MTNLHGPLDELVERDKRACEKPGADACVRIVAVADLPTRFGAFKIVSFWNNRDEKEHIALVHGDVRGAEEVPTRLHSECLTGDALGSLRCDCRDQLEAALERLSRETCGLLLYLRQEGRGIGLINKIRAYSLQDEGMDTVEANLALGFLDDERDYTVAAQMVHSLEIGSIRLMTNNPEKIDQLREYGVRVAGRIPHMMKPNAHNQFYLDTKAARSGHLIVKSQPALREQADQAAVHDSTVERRRKLRIVGGMPEPAE